MRIKREPPKETESTPEVRRIMQDLVQRNEIFEGRGGDMRMPFGKHKGTAIRDLNDGYIEWMLTNLDDVETPLYAALTIEHDRRGGL